tara:strand:+ start:147 stop:2330 length:2184 start_codon:yes stop_codon:yes gene_type:complete
MAEELTIDTSKLTKTAIKFREGMTALLDTEYEYIQYLRNRGGIMGVGSNALGNRNLLQLDYAKKWHHNYGGGGSGRYYRRRIKKPKTNRFPTSKANRFNQLRMQRRMWKQLTKMGLKPNQIREYFRLRNLPNSNYNHYRAIDAARRLTPTGNWLTNSFTNFRQTFQRPDWMTRKNWGPLRPGVRDRVGDFFTKKKMGVGNNKTLQPKLKLPGFLKGLKGIFSMKNINNSLAVLGFGLDLKDRVSNEGQKWWKAVVGAGASTWCAVKAGGAMATKFATLGSALGPWGAGIGGLVGGILGATLGASICGGIADTVTGANSDTTEKKKFGGLVQGVAQCTDCASTSKHSNGAVITSPTRGMLGGTKALVGEANEAEIILPMSKIGDAISAVYREGASIMVGATLAFLGPLAGGSPAAASIVNEARRIAKLTGADTDVKVDKINLPKYLPAIVTNKTNNYLEEDSNEALFASNKSESEGSGSTTNTSSTTITGTNRWKTILPQGDPLFSSPFGMRWGRMHRGIDIGVWENSPVHAQEGGVVEQIIPKFGEYGGAVVVAHPDGTANLYGHVYDYVVKPGQKIEKGDPLAKIIYYPGSDGSNQSHLHFERFNKSGTRIDPLPYFQQGGASIDAQSNSSGNIDPVNQGGPANIMRDISSSFINIGSTSFNQNKQELIDTPVNTTNVGNTTQTLVTLPVPYMVPVPVNRYVTVPDETKNETKMVIDVFGKGASRS